MGTNTGQPLNIYKSADPDNGCPDYDVLVSCYGHQHLVLQHLPHHSLGIQVRHDTHELAQVTQQPHLNARGNLSRRGVPILNLTYTCKLDHHIPTLTHSLIANKKYNI